MNKFSKIVLFTFCLCYVLCAFSTVAYAVEVDTNYVPLTTIPGVFTQGQATNPVNVLKGVYGLAIGIGSVIAVVMIIFAGFKYMYQESMSGKSGAKEMIQNAIYGLLLILASYIILRTINPALVEFDVNLPGGSGRLQALLALQTQSDNLHAELLRGAPAREAIRTEIAGIVTNIGTKQAEIDSLETDIEELGLTPAEIKANQDKIAILKGDIANLQKDQVTKSIAIRTIETQISTGLNRQAHFTDVASQLDALIKEKGDSSAPSEITTIVNSLSGYTTSQTEYIQRLIDEAKALPITDANRAQVNAYVASAQQNIAYLQTSKSLIDDVKSLPQVYMTNNVSGVPSSNPLPIAQQSAQFDAVISKYNQQIATYTAQNRPDLAANLQKDISGITTVMKVGVASKCGGSANASLTLCKP
jgi:hypothetical protein